MLLQGFALQAFLARASKILRPGGESPFLAGRRVAQRSTGGPIPRTKEPAVAAPETKSRKRRAASRAPANGTVEARKQDLQRLLDALRSARDGETGKRP